MPVGEDVGVGVGDEAVHATALDAMNLNFTEGYANVFTQDLLQHLLKEDAIHQSYLKQREEGEKAKLCVEDLVKATGLTGGLMFKVRHTPCDGTVLVIWQDMEKKNHTANAKTVLKHVKTYNEITKHLLPKVSKLPSTMAQT